MSMFPQRVCPAMQLICCIYCIFNFLNSYLSFKYCNTMNMKIGRLVLRNIDENEDILNNS